MGKPSFLRFVPVYRLSSDFAKAQLLEAIHIIESAGGQTIGTMSDNHTVNRRMYMLLRNEFPIDGVNFKIVHPEDSARQFYLFLDPVHLFKSIRNNWYSEKTQRLKFYSTPQDEEMVADWRDLVDLYEKELGHSVKRVFLSQRALRPSSFEKQKVQLAVQVFNDKTVAALAQDVKSATAAFVYHVTRLWKILNTHSPRTHLLLNDPDRAPIRSESDAAVDILRGMIQFFKRMDTCTGRQRIQTLTAETKAGFVQTLEGLVDIIPRLLSDQATKYVLLGYFQSDVLDSRI